MKNYYQILGIEKDADLSILKKTYKRLAKEFHPDLNKNEGSQIKFIEITEAYKVLSDPFERIKYNQLFYKTTVNLPKDEEKENNKTSILVNYKYYAFALLSFFVLVVSYYQFNSKPDIKQKTLVKSNNKNIELNPNKYNNSTFEITKEKTIEETPKKNKLNKNDIVDNVNIVKIEKEIINSNTNLADNSVKLKKVSSKLIENPTSKKIELNKTDIVNNESINTITIIKTEKEIAITTNANIKKEEKTIPINSKKNKPFSIYNDSNSTNKINVVVIKAKDIKITSLQHVKGEKYKVPKKINKTDSFKIDANIFNNSVTKINSDVSIMLVIKNTKGETLKIDVKNLDFNNNESKNITFYEKFKDQLTINEPYYFYFYANKRLIMKTKKII